MNESDAVSASDRWSSRCSGAYALLNAVAIARSSTSTIADCGPESAAATLVASYLAVAGGLTWDALRWEVAADGGPISAAERFVRAVRAALFSAIWLGALPAALWRLATRRGRVRYDKMSHHGRPAGG